MHDIIFRRVGVLAHQAARPPENVVGGYAHPRDRLAQCGHRVVLVHHGTVAGPDLTEVTLTYRQLGRHGEFGQQVWHAVASASPGESLQRYADAVRRPAVPARG